LQSTSLSLLALVAIVERSSALAIVCTRSS